MEEKQENSFFITKLYTGKKVQQKNSTVCTTRSDGLLPLSMITIFTITAEIHARSLVNFYRQYADRHMNLKFMCDT